MQVNITQHYEVPDEIMDHIASDLICTAVEGGINYWAQVDEYHHVEDRPSETRCVVSAKDDTGGGSHHVQVSTMRLAIVRLLSGQYKPFGNDGYPLTYRDRLIRLILEVQKNSGQDYLHADYDYDAIDADAMLQLAIYEEIVYG